MKEIKLNRKCKTIEEHEDFCDFTLEEARSYVRNSNRIELLEGV